MNYFYVILVLTFIFSSLGYVKPKTKLLISAQSQSQTSLMINSKIDEENDTNKLDEENDKPINELNDSVRSNEDSPPMKKK